MIMTQCALRARFELGLDDSAPNKKIIHNWIPNHKETSSAMKKTPSGRPQTSIGPENVALIRASIEQSPWRAARKHMENHESWSETTNPQNVTVQELSPDNFQTYQSYVKTSCGTFLPKLVSSAR